MHELRERVHAWKRCGVSVSKRERERILNEIGEQGKNFNYLYGLKVELYLMKMLPQNV